MGKRPRKKQKKRPNLLQSKTWRLNLRQNRKQKGKRPKLQDWKGKDLKLNYLPSRRQKKKQRKKPRKKQKKRKQRKRPRKKQKKRPKKKQKKRPNLLQSKTWRLNLRQNRKQKGKR